MDMVMTITSARVIGDHAPVDVLVAIERGRFSFAAGKAEFDRCCFPRSHLLLLHAGGAFEPIRQSVIAENLPDCRRMPARIHHFYTRNRSVQSSPRKSK